MTCIDIDPDMVQDILRDAGYPDQYTLEPIQQEASQRKYYRLNLTEHEERSLVLCECFPIPDPDTDDFIVINKFLYQNRLPVSRIRSVNQTHAFLLLEDGGSSDLTSAYKDLDDSASRRELLLHAIDILFSFHKLKPEFPVSDRFFDYKKLHWEMEFLLNNIEKVIGARSVPLLDDRIKGFLSDLCQTLGSAGTHVFTHRDYHGRNILLNDQYRMNIVDYQDARMGLPFYDLSSLLYDPYTGVDEEDRSYCLEYFLKHSPVDLPSIGYYYQSVIQRLLKALGTYLFLTFEKNMIRYNEFISVTLQILSDLIRTEYGSPVLYDFVHRLSDELESYI